MAKKKKQATPLHNDILNFYKNRGITRRPVTPTPDYEEINPGIGYFTDPTELQNIAEQYTPESQEENRQIGLLEGSTLGRLPSESRKGNFLNFLDVTAHNIVKQEVESDLGKISSTKEDLENLTKMKRLVYLHNILNSGEGNENDMAEYQDLTNYFLNEGIRSRKVIDMMYNVDNLSDDDLTKLYESQERARQKHWDEQWDKVENPWQAIKYGASRAWDEIGSTFSNIGKTSFVDAVAQPALAGGVAGFTTGSMLGGGAGSIAGPIGTGVGYGAGGAIGGMLGAAGGAAFGTLKYILGNAFGGTYRKDFLQQIHDLDLDDNTKNNILSKTFMPFHTNYNPISHASNIDKEQEEYKQDLDEYVHDLQNDLKQLRTGKFNFYTNNPVFGKGNLFDDGIKVYSPEDIDWKEARRQEEKWNEASIFDPTTWGTFLNPSAVVPELASTIGMFKHQAQAYVADRGINAILTAGISKLPTLFGKQGQIIGALALKGTGAAASVGLGLMGAINSRKQETDLEKIQALQSNVLQQFVQEGIDANEVFRQYKEYAEKELKIDTSQLDDATLLTLGLSFNVPVQGIPGYDKIIKNAQKGIMKVVNANNALAIHDYLEYFPFSTVGGKVFDRVGSAAFGSLKKYTPESIKNIAQKAADTKIVTAINSYTRNVTDKFVRNAMKSSNAKRIFAGLAMKDVGRWLGNKAKLGAYEGFLEGGEEGAQHLIQERYLRGEYDDYIEPYQMFDLSEMLNTNGLYSQAFFDYFGLDPDDADNASVELRKAMTIGAVSSMWFSTALGALSNFRNNPNDQNLRQLYHRIRADHTVGRLISNYASRAQDAAHIATYFDKLRQNKGQVAHLVNALNNAKNALDESVTNVQKSDIDADIKLAYTTGLMYNSTNTKDILKTLDIKEGSDEHKQFVIDAVTKILDAENIETLVNNQQQSLDNIIKSVFDKVNEFITLSESNDNDGLQQFKDKDSLMYNILDRLYKNATRVVDKRNKASEDLVHAREGEIKKINAEKKKYISNNKKRKKRNTNISKRMQLFADYNLSSEDIWLLEYFGLIDKFKNANTEKDQQDVINEAKELYNTQTNIDGSKYKSNYINVAIRAALNELQTRSLTDALNKAKDRLERLKFAQQQTGVDIDTNRMEIMIESIQELLDSHIEKSNKEYKSWLNLDEVTDVNSKSMLELLYNTLDNRQLADELLDSGVFENQSEFTETLKAFIFNSAMYKHASREASLYMDAISVKDYKGNIMSPEDVLGEIQDNIERAEKRRYVARRRREEELDLPEDSLSDENLNSTEEEQKPEIPEQPTDTSQDDVEESQPRVAPNPQTEAEARADVIINGKPLPTEETNRKRADRIKEKNKKKEEKKQKEKEQKPTVEEQPEETPQTQSKQPVVEQPVEQPEPQQEKHVEEVGKKQEEEPTEQPQVDQDAEEEAKKAELEGQTGKYEDPIIEDLTSDEQGASVLEEFEEDPPLSVIEDIDDVDPKQANEAELMLLDAEAALQDKEELEDAIHIDQIDSISFDSETGLFEVDGEPLSETQTAQLWGDILVNQGLEEHIDMPEKKQNTTTENADNDTIGDLVSATFFYQPDSKEVLHLGREDAPVTFKGKTIRTGSELAKKLTEKRNGKLWLSGCKKYYIVTNPSKTDSVLPGQDVRDAFTVALVIEDGNDVYIVTLRSLGVTISKQTERYKDKVQKSKDEDEYLKTWSALTGKKAIVNNAEEDLTKWLELKGINFDFEIDGEKTESVIQFLNRHESNEDLHIQPSESFSNEFKARMLRKAVMMLAISNARKVHEGLGIKSSFEDWWSNDEEDYAVSKSKIIPGRLKREYFIHNARKHFAMPGKKVMSRATILQQIQKLREFRNSIIDAYLGQPKIENGEKIYDFPQTPRTDVTPLEVTQSNGKFDNTDTFRPVVPENMSIEEVTQQIEDGKLIFGYGTGAFGNTPYSIVQVHNTGQQVILSGTGLSGKIYLMIDGLVNSGKRIPMMLSEEKFNYQIDENGRKVFVNGITLAMDPKTGQHNDQEARQPSAAEVLMYMLCGKLAGMQDMSISDRSQVAEFFIHSGEKTLIQNQKNFGNTPISQFLGKQLWFDSANNILYISVPTDESVPARQFTLKQYSTAELFAETQDGAEKRLEVTKAIANQMHWNTDVEYMNSTLAIATGNQAIHKFLKDLFIQKYTELLEQGKDTNQDIVISIAGCEQLSFKMSDFFEGYGAQMKEKAVNVTAWMVKNMKLKTNVSEQVFSAPFVFANGVSEQSNRPTTKAATKQTSQKKQETKKEVQDKKMSEEEKNSYYQEVFRKLGSLNLTDKFNAADPKKQGSYRFIYNAKPKKEYTNEDVFDNIVKNIKDILKRVYDDKNIDQIIDNVKQQLNIEKTLIRASHDNSIPLQISISEDATVNIKQVETVAIKKGPRSKQRSKLVVNGVFSTKKTSNKKLDENAARTWLARKLGLEDADVIIVDAIGQTLNDKEIFGMTNVALDTMWGYISLSREAEVGTEYHEAFHFVNLLIHNKQQRNAVYESALRRNKKLLFNLHTSTKDIEEWLADEFKKYAELRESKSWSSKIKRLFANIAAFMLGTSNKYAYYQVFKDIQNGKYAKINPNNKIDLSSAQDFVDRYNNGAYKMRYKLPGVPKDKTGELEERLDSYHDWYEAVHSISNSIQLGLNISNPSDLFKLINKDSNFEKIVVGKVKSMIQELEEYDDADREIQTLKTLLGNKSLLKKLFVQRMESLGIKTKIKKIKDIDKENTSAGSKIVEETPVEKENEDPTVREDRPDNTYDQVQLTVNKKDNAGLRAKMFFKNLPVYKQEYTENGVELYIDTDRFGVEKLYDDDEAWFTILNELYSCTSFAEIDKDGKYKSTSIMGSVDRLKNISPFWKSVYDKLEELQLSNNESDIALKSQILSALCGAKNQIAYVSISDEKTHTKSSQDILEDQDYMFEDFDEIQDSYTTDEAVEDRTRRWELVGDDALIVSRQVPRRWSQYLYEKGYVIFDREKGESHVNEQFVESLKQKFESTKKTLKDNSTTYEQATKEIIDILNFIGIPADIETIDTFAHLYISNTDTENSKYQQTNEQYSIADKFSFLKRSFGINDGKKHGISGPGSIYGVINSIIQSSGKPSITVSKKDRKLNEAFNNYQTNSQIAYLAIAYNTYHPNLQDQTVKGPNGDRYYPINQANYISSFIKRLNSPYDTKDGGVIEEMKKSLYCQHSLLLNATQSVSQHDPKKRFRLCTCVGMKDANKEKGADYFDISDRDDLLYKLFLTENDHFINPTMADKKTYYGIKAPGVTLVHDFIVDTYNVPYEFIRKSALNYIKENGLDLEQIKKDSSIYSWIKSKKKVYDENRDLYELADTVTEEQAEVLKEAAIYDEIYTNAYNEYRASIESVGGIMNVNSFSKRTLEIFAGYFSDEIESLKQYYSKENIEYLIKNPDKLIENFHGNIKDGKMDFSGNGGKFRYFYDVQIDNNGLNLNQKLELLYNLQKQIMSGDLNEEKWMQIKGDGVNKAITKSDFGENPDGFELIRWFLDNLDREYFVSFMGKQVNQKSSLLYDINNILMQRTAENMFKYTEEGSSFQLGEHKDGLFIPLSIPKQFAENYIKNKEDDRAKAFKEVYGEPESSYYGLPESIQSDIFKSIIANYTANSIISIIETEKAISGDPAFYEWKKNKYEESTNITFNGNVSIKDKNGNSWNLPVSGYKTTVENLYDTYSNKIKRLGAVLSPGAQLRLDFSKFELDKYPELLSKRYTILDVEDIKTPSEFIKPIEDQFRKQLVVDHIRVTNPEWFVEKFVKHLDKYPKSKLAEGGRYAFEDAIDMIYSNEQFYNDVLKELPKEALNIIESQLESQIKPYKKITVADAQVFIGPALYRKIKTGLGEWSFEEDANGYSDEVAYNIIEKGIYTGSNKELREKYKNHKISDTEWMKTPELYTLVSKFQTNVLKMSYFENFAEQFGKININRPIYNKMAMFPLFKFHRGSEVGKKLYDRMNNKQLGVIDMIAFKSAVKVGAVKNAVTLTQKDGKLSKNVYSLSDILDVRSSVNIDYEKDKLIYPTKNDDSEKMLEVKVQTLEELRLQLNTHAHEATERSMGTQMFKIAFSNIIDDALYGKGTAKRRGSEIKKDIMKQVNALTNLGITKIKERFFTVQTDDEGNVKKDANGNPLIKLDTNEIKKYVQSIITSNGLGVIAEDLIHEGNAIASLTSRDIFEQAVASLLNAEVVDITTNGGTAVQQSVFGFADSAYNSQAVRTYDEYSYKRYNDGKELNWNKSDGTMEVLLSMNFFKAVIPKEHQTDDDTMRRWLIENDVIKGTKLDGTQSNPRPFGIGYRIPTQGMSSMFGFIVADVLPELSGDTIVVPREFTAQTGSDFDIDKLYLALFSYDKEGKRESLIKIGEDGKKYVVSAFEATQGMYSNKLLNDYLTIITDRRNYANARASIDVITGIIHDELLDGVLQSPVKGYIPSFYQLTPFFQASRKREFGVGKRGIGPFALNITNMALTQYAHVSIDFGANEYKLGRLDRIYGKDGMRIADWLSAMVNAHVDVAKDAYVFDLNVNSATYNMCNLLLRCGYGKQTFLFLAQDCLKQYAQAVMNAGGIYGAYNESGKNTNKSMYSKKKAVMNSLREKLLSRLKRLNDDKNLNWTDDQKKLLENVINVYDTKSKDKKKVQRIESKDVLFTVKKKSVFGISNRAQNSIITSRKLNAGDEVTKEEEADCIIIQLYSLEAFTDLSEYAEEMSSLVKCSQIDTKKFGNNLISKYNFLNNVEFFKNKEDILWVSTNDRLQKKYEQEYINSHPGEKENEARSNARKYASKKIKDDYFTKTYLQTKLTAAVKYQRQLLLGQSFKSSPAYTDIFYTICNELYGSWAATGVDGKPHKGYSMQFNDDALNAIGSFIDDMFRFTSLVSTNDTQNYVIDLAKNGNLEEIKTITRNLIYGEYSEDSNGEIVKKSDSIFDRVSMLIEDIRNNPNDYEGLVDENGKLINDLLLYLRPLGPSKDFPIGRMWLNTPRHLVKSESKGVLQAAFSELLTYQGPKSIKNAEVRKLAEDLILYAYYSTYDQATRNSFFELVPLEYRKQYDKALRNSLRSNRNSKEENKRIIVENICKIDSRYSENLQDYDYSQLISIASQIILDVMSRNLWYDNQYVKSIRVPRTSNNNNLKLKTGNITVYGQRRKNRPGGQDFPVHVITNVEDAAYVKIIKGGETMLYKKSGYVTKQEKDKEKDVAVIYLPITKAGLHKGTNNWFELYCTNGVSSVFADNKIKTDFAEDNTRKAVQKAIDSANSYTAKENNKKYSNGVLTANFYTEDIPVSNMSDNNEAYQDEVQNTGNLSEVAGTGKVISRKNANSAVLKRSDIVININNDIVDVESEEYQSQKYRNVSGEGILQKTVSIGLNISDEQIDQIVKKIIEAAEALGEDQKVTIGFTTGTFDNEWIIDDNFRKQYIEDEVQRYKEELSNSRTPSEKIDELVESYRDVLESSSVQDLNNGKEKRVFWDQLRELRAEQVANSIEKIMQKVLNISYVETVLAPASKGKLTLSRAVVKIHENKINRMSAVDQKTTIMLDSSLSEGQTIIEAKHHIESFKNVSRAIKAKAKEDSAKKQELSKEVNKVIQKDENLADPASQPVDQKSEKEQDLEDAFLDNDLFMDSFMDATDYDSFDELQQQDDNKKSKNPSGLDDSQLEEGKQNGLNCKKK